MPYYATLSTTPSIYDDKITGYAKEDTHHIQIAKFDNSFIIVALILIASNFIVLGLSTHLFVTISESIEATDNGKPKFYYHFWSTMLLITGGIWGYEVCYHAFRKFPLRFNPYLLLLILMFTISSFGTVIALSSVRGKIKAFSAPLSECCCCNKSKCCRLLYTKCMTALGLYLTISLVTYLAYATPTIVLVYYLYPTRTLIRVPFIIGVIFYTIALQSLILYLFEILHHGMTQYKLCWINNSPSYRSMEDPSDQSVDDNKCRCEWDGRHIEEQCEHSNKYYTKKMEEEKIISQQCYLILAFIRLVAGIIILAAFICGVVVIASLVFEQTNNTDTKNLLALLPTIVFSIFGWFVRGLVF